jgi:hypothetical protein
MEDVFLGYSSLIRERDYCRKHGVGANNARCMSAPGGIFDQTCIPWAKLAHRAVSQPNFQLAGENNHILSAWGWMPVDKRSYR